MNRKDTLATVLAVLSVAIARVTLDPYFRGDTAAETPPTRSQPAQMEPRAQPYAPTPAMAYEATGLTLTALTEDFPTEVKSVLENVDASLNADIDDLLQLKEYKKARAILVELAAEAVTEGDRARLGNTLLLLGKVATQEQELDTAEVYLLEALDITESNQDSNGTAQVYMQLGRMHIRSRQLARSAANAYDTLLVARNQLSRGQYSVARNNLKDAIRGNLAIKRYGAAAGAYETLVRLHQKLHETHEAELAAAEAARLYATSGQPAQARIMLGELKRMGTEESRFSFLTTEINSLASEHQKDASEIERAKDYQRLYHHYVSKGEYERAWKLRVLASQSMAKTSKRSMYHRQADVIAVLYNSNSAMEKAKNYLQRASALSAGDSEEQFTSQLEQLSSQIF